MEQTEGPGFCSKVRNFTIVTAECEAEPEALLSGGPRVTATVASSPAVQTARCPMQWKPLQQEGRATPGLPRCLSLRARSPMVLRPVSANTRSMCLFLFLVAGGGKARPALTLVLRPEAGLTFSHLPVCASPTPARARSCAGRLDYFLNYSSLQYMNIFVF